MNSIERHRRHTLPCEKCDDFKRFVREHPDGAKLEEIGDFFGLTRERIRQIEHVAMCKLRLMKNRIRIS